MSRLTVKDVAADVADLRSLMEGIAAQLGAVTPVAPVATAAPVAKPEAAPKKPVDPDKARVTALFKAGKDARKAFRAAVANAIGVTCDHTMTVKVLIAASNELGFDWRPIADELIG